MARPTRPAPKRRAPRQRTARQPQSTRCGGRRDGRVLRRAVLPARRSRSAYRRLGDIERLGSARDMLAFCDSDEDTKLFDRHRLDVIRLPSSAAIRRPPRGPPESPSAPDHRIGIPSAPVVGASLDRRRRGPSISEAGLRDSRQSPGRPSRRLAPRTYSASSRPRHAKRRGIGEAAPEPCRRNDRSDSCC
jgi:hypothetical protein